MTDAANPDPPLRVATWNIHDARGWTGQRNLECVADVLSRLQAPIVGLQEIRCGSGACDAAYLARQHGYEWRAIETRRHAGIDHGNALLTSLPVLGTRAHDLSVDRREPRAALEVDLAWKGSRLRVVVTHLGLRAHERRVQVERLLALVPNDEVTTILLGDINEWWLWGRPLRSLHRRFGTSPSVLTYPAHLPLFALDRIWVSPPWAVTALSALAGRDTWNASDHRVVVATLRPRGTATKAELEKADGAGG
jgi:phospholipase D1/2